MILPDIGSVRLENVSKRYRLGSINSLQGLISTAFFRGENSNDVHQLWALKDISFNVKPGDSLGLIGRNGAGKTTVLKLLSNITRPTAGTIQVGGRISSLIELGAGFHPELSGRENIYLNGAILGLNRREIRTKIDDIISFSELSQFIDTPVKRYSSGMYVRLGFAVAAHVEPDVLLVDEVLAVGDASFRFRCTKRIKELQEQGTTIIFVSHNLHLVRDVCRHSLYLHQGQIKAIGATDEVISLYEKEILSPPSEVVHDPKELSVGAAPQASKTNLLITGIRVGSCVEAKHEVLQSIQCAAIFISYAAGNVVPIGRINVRILRDDGVLCCNIDSNRQASTRKMLAHLSGQGTVEIILDPLQLTSGTYFAEVRITDLSDNLVLASGQSQRFQVHSEGSTFQKGVFEPAVKWAWGERNAAES
jgi:lipopolysaccharide transport system ATP-binding protein